MRKKEIFILEVFKEKILPAFLEKGKALLRAFEIKSINILNNLISINIKLSKVKCYFVSPTFNRLERISNER